MGIKKLLIISGLLATQAAVAHGPEPLPLIGVPVPPVPGLLDGPDPIVIDKDKAIALGKALFWDVNVGSDGMACGSCHHHAGADRRVKNQLNPGLKGINGFQASGQTFGPLPSGALGGPNYTLKTNDFPLFQYNDPLYRESGVKFSTDDVVSSSGSFSGEFLATSKFSDSNDQCVRNTDPIFHLNSTGTRRVEPRNVPTMINSIFNYRNFWDGRANNVFNGSSTWGDRDPNAGVWVKTGARSVSKQRLNLINSSLASLAMGPPLNENEMACRNRSLQAVGRKLLLRQPLQNQKVHHQDSVFAPLNLTLSTAGEQKNGLNTTYKALITQAFNPKYWSYSGLNSGFGTPPAGQAPYNQMEANFSMFFGLALQLYQSTLISDQAPIDLVDRVVDLDAGAFVPTWTFPASTGIVYSQEKIDKLARGETLFRENHCNLCHAGPVMTTAAIVSNSLLVTPTADPNESDGVKKYGPPNFRIDFGPDAMAPYHAAYAAGISSNLNVVQRDATTTTRKLMDMGFFNTGVNTPDADPGIGGQDDFGNPLSFSSQYQQYLLGNNAAVKDSAVLSNVSACNFLSPFGGTDADMFPSSALEIDGSREGSPRTQNCLYPSRAYIPTVAAANAALNTSKMAMANSAAFKVPSLRNVELTGPYMHNGSMATLEQVVEFYSRKGNVVVPTNTNQHTFVSAVQLGYGDEYDREAVIEFLKTFTDDRVRYEKAPFDHPEVVVPHGHQGDSALVDAGNAMSPNLAIDEFLVVPAVGAQGNASPILPFADYLAPATP